MKGFLFFSLATSIATVLAQSPFSSRPADPEGQFPRLGACPDPHACIFPPDASTFLPGAYFDLRVELHAYDKNRSRPTPDAYNQFKTSIRKDNGKWVDLNVFFKSQSSLETWKFNWTDSIETEYSSNLKNGKTPVQVAVASRAWRKLRLDRPGIN
ncbi:hypothetical protein G6F56_013458 [Rhizopus delemar]|nr:hypothetical protein G6F56_013458 [Rhizopus delemar]